MFRANWRKKTTLLLLPLSLLTTASCASNALLGGRPTQIDPQAVEEQIQRAYPTFPRPDLRALQALRTLNDPHVNKWIQELAVLCRQLDEECRDER